MRKVIPAASEDMRPLSAKEANTFSTAMMESASNSAGSSNVYVFSNIQVEYSRSRFVMFKFEVYQKKELAEQKS